MQLAAEELKSQQMRHEFDLEVEQKAKKTLKKENENLEMELKIAKEEITSLKMTVAKMTADSLGITTELQATKVSVFSGFFILSLSHMKLS